MEHGLFFFSSRRRHTRCSRDWSSDVCSSDLYGRENPPKRPGICDNDGAKLVVRPDDMPDRVRERMREYESKTALLIGYYKPRGVVRAVDGVGTVEDVEKRITQALR